MKLGLSLKFSQSLSLTPQLQQAIKLLQLSGVELQESLLEQVRDNPFLEWQAESIPLSIKPTGEVHTASPDWAAGMQSTPVQHAAESSSEATPSTEPSADWADTDTADSATSSRDGRIADAHDDTASDLGWVAAAHTTLLEHLQQQIRLCNASSLTVGLLNELIEALTPEGWFEQDFAGLCTLVAQRLDVPEDEFLSQSLAAAIAQLQQLDPPGVGANGLQHCLQLQLSHPDPADCVLDCKMSVFKCAQRILAEGFDLLAARDRNALKKRLKTDDITLAAAITLIRQLDPKPGLAFELDRVEYALPEVLVVRVAGQWQARLNPAVVPPLRVQETHSKFIKNKSLPPDVSAGLQAQLAGAKQLVRTVQQHFDTVFRVGQAIVAAQQAYFDFGAKKLKPMVLRDIADTLGLHESTISRVTTKKYLQTPFGVMEMKYFFSSGLSSTTSDGDNASSTAIKALLDQLLKGEPAHKPLSDQALSDALSASGHTVARRTVAKYREQLGVAPAHARKPM